MSDVALPTPRDWVGAQPFPWPPAHALPEGSVLRACYCVLEHSIARTRQDQPYLRLTLLDRYGQLEARVWNGAETAAALLRPGGYVGVQGRVEYFNGSLQLNVDALQPVRVGLDELELFLPRSERSDAEMAAALEQLIASVQDAPLRALLCELLGADSGIGQAFRLAPAAKHNHHAYLGGLLEHTLSVTRICDLLADHYGPQLDRDLLISAALLHDIGKVREIGARAGFPYTDEGKLLGHILLGIQMVHEAAAAIPELPPGRLLLLEHLIASHQGRYEWQSPREPSILEGLVLHYADDLDAKLQQVHELMAHSSGHWTAYDRGFRRDFLLHLAPVGQLAQVAMNAGAADVDGSASVPARDRTADGPRPAAAEAREGAADVDALASVPARDSVADGPGDEPADADPERDPGAGARPALSEDTLDLFT